MKILWLDAETTGTDPDEHGIMQLCVMVEIDREIIAEQEFLLNPLSEDLKVNDEALDVNGYTRDQIAKHVSYKEGFFKIKRFLDLYVDKYKREDKFTIAGYNVRFDVSFLRSMWLLFGDKFFNSYFRAGVIDPFFMVETLMYCKRMTRLNDSKLTTIAEYFNIETEGAHDAMVDVKLTREVFISMLMLLGQWNRK